MIPFKGTDQIWIGKEYSRTYNRDMTESATNAMFQSFQKFVGRMAEKVEYNNVDYFVRVVNSDQYDGFLAAIQTKHLNSDKTNSIVLLPKRGKLNDDNGITGYSLFISILVLHILAVVVFYFSRMKEEPLL